MNIKEKILAVSIAIVFLLFVIYGIRTFYPEPRMNDFCSGIPSFVSVDKCPEMQEGAEPVPPAPRPFKGECWCEQDCSNGTCVQTGKCRDANPEYKKCVDEFEKKREGYNKGVFITALIIGVIALVSGSLFISIDSVASGIMGGGTLTLFYGTVRYWGDLGDVERFLLLGLALIVLVWVGFKKLNSLSNDGKNKGKGK